MKTFTPYASTRASSRASSSGLYSFSPDTRGRTFDLRQAKGIALALAFAGALFVLIAFLDGVAQADDVSPGTAFAAMTPAPSRVDVVPLPEAWAADTTAQGTRPDAIH